MAKTKSPKTRSPRFNEEGQELFNFEKYFKQDNKMYERSNIGNGSSLRVAKGQEGVLSSCTKYIPTVGIHNKHNFK